MGRRNEEERVAIESFVGPRIPVKRDLRIGMLD
jgi:hypothetical protein